MANYPQQPNKNKTNPPSNKGGKQGMPANAPARGNIPPWAAPAGGSPLFPPAQQAPYICAYPGQQPYAAPQRAFKNEPPAPQLTPKQIKKLEKQKRREKDYFFVMRKFPSFLIFLLCLVLVAIIALPVVSYFVALPETLTSVLDPNIAAFAKADNTPLDERGEEYVDTTEYISFGDIILGSVNSVAKGFVELGFLKDEEGNSRTPFFDATQEYLDLIEDPSDTMAPIAKLVFRFAPLGLIIVLILAIINMIKAFAAMFGKRIFKRFGLMAIISLVFSVLVLVGGVIALGVEMGNPQMVEENFLSVLDFNQLLPFLTGFINNPPVTAVDLTISAPPVVMQAGLGSIILAGVSVLILFLSFFARKKVPYSIFDK